MPPNNTYNGFAGSWTGSGLTAGRKWTMNASFFPASGYRLRSDGKFYDVGSYGSYMMSTPDDTTLRHTLNFTSGAVYPNGAGYRSVGLSMRCISE